MPAIGAVLRLHGSCGCADLRECVAPPSSPPLRPAWRRLRAGFLSAPGLPPLAAPPCADLGAAYGTAKSGVGVSSMGVMKPDLIMKSIIPVVMAGVLGIYGLIIAVIIANQGAFPSPDPSLEARLPPSPLPRVTLSSGH